MPTITTRNTSSTGSTCNRLRRRSGHGTTGPAGPAAGLPRDDDLHHQHVTQHRDDAGQNGRDEQLADGLLGEDGVDHERHRRRDHDAQRAAGGQCAGRERARVAEAAQLRQRHLPHRRGGRDRRPANRAEARAGADRRHGNAAAKVAEERADEAEQRLRQAAMGGELAHQQEERNDDEVVIRQPRVGEILERIEQRGRVAASEVEVAAKADDEHCDADRNPHDHQHQHDAEDHESRLDPAHVVAAARNLRTLM